MNEILEKILSPEANWFLNALHDHFHEKRAEILRERSAFQARIDAGENPGFLKSSEAIRSDSSWKCASIPHDLKERFVEITGPVDAKMMINALNSGANGFMADFEDALSPSWENLLWGQEYLKQAVRRTLQWKSPEGKEYKLKEHLATLHVRPRGWHFLEPHYKVNNHSISASLFDAGLFLFHNAKELLDRGSGPYLYLPKMEHAKEAALWQEVFSFSEQYLRIPRHSIKATVLIETLPAAFEMEEILFALKEYIVALNAGRWDYIFSAIKTFAERKNLLFPDRDQITMNVPFMSAYATLLVETCNKRGATPMGGMSAFIPSRKDEEINAKSIKAVIEDKKKEVDRGFKGAWVAHPDLVKIVQDIFKEGKAVSIKNRKISEQELLDFHIAGGKITRRGFHQNLKIAFEYMVEWLQGQGAVALNNLMEDAATAEISRSLVWQWLHHDGKFEDGEKITLSFAEEIIQQLENERNTPQGLIAAAILKDVISPKRFVEFITLKGATYL